MNRLDLPVLSYCEIPDKLTEDHWMSENQPDSYIKYNVTPKEKQSQFDDDFEIDNWIIEKYPDLSGKEILIHIDF